MIRTAEEVLGSNKTGGRSFNVLKAMEEYADQFKQKWIPVTEPPESGMRYNIRREKFIAVAYFVNGDWVMKLPDGRTIEYTGITHYCKLPEL